MQLEFCGQVFQKILKTPNFVTIRPVGAEMFHADGRTDGRDEVNSSFWKFYDSEECVKGRG